MKTLIIFCSALILITCSRNHFMITPYDLKCEYLTNPIGIENPKPVLFWKLKSTGHNQVQSAYQVLVSSSEENLRQDIGDLWDSGKVFSEQSVFVRYAGAPLHSTQRVFWKVRAWDQSGAQSDWSPPAFWEMALLDSSDWKSMWIGRGEDKNPNSFETDPAPYFRKQFTLNKKIKRARVYITGLGYYELSLNARTVGEGALVPAQTNYDRRNLRNLIYYYDDQSTTRVLYNIYDVTGMLRQGDTVAGVILGNGWYNQRDRRAEGWMWYDTPRFIFQMHVTFENGTDSLFISDSSWRVGDGPLRHDGIFTGNLYDARLEKPGWNEPGFDDSAWQQAPVVRPPTGKLEAQLAPMDKVVRTLPAKSVTKIADNTYEFDAGEMISGWARIKLRGNPGDSITLRFYEELGSSYSQQDTYICRGGGEEVFEPKFTWHAFRTVRVSGLNYLPRPTDMEIRVVNTAVEPAGSFECSNELFNRIYDNYIRTQLGNFHGAFSSDCPHRERLGYTGDGQLLVESSIFNFDMTQVYRKWINDMDDARNKKSGYVPHTAPFGGGGGGPAWGSSYVIVPWFYYLYYGDTEVLSQHFDGMKQWVDYLGTRTDGDNIVVREEPNGWCLGDWATPAKIELPEPLVNTAFYYYCAKTVSEVANILGRVEEGRKYSLLAREIADSFHSRFFNPRRPGYWTGYQGSDVFPLAFGMSPDSLVSGVFASLVNHVEKNKGHLDTGILATPLLLEVLTEMGRPDLAFTIMNQWDFPGFGWYILGKGATTLWENWDGGASHSHPMYGSVIRWFFKYLAGIQPDAWNPGFKHIMLKPTPCGDLGFVRANYESIYGTITSIWRFDKSDFIWDVEVPVNTTATLFIPAKSNANVSVKPRKFSFTGFENSRVILTVGSGRYHITSRGARELVKPVRLPTPIIGGGDELVKFPETATISIEAHPGAEIRYTIDGSEPDESSQLFKGAFEVSSPCTIKARVFAEGYLPSYTTAKKIRFIDPKRNGIRYTVSVGHWQNLPNREQLTPVSSGRSFDFDVNKIKRPDDWVAIEFEGNFHIDMPGEYTFFASANDGCLLYVDGRLVVDEAGYSGISQKSGSLNLKAGDHYIKVFYFEETGTESLDIGLAGPGLERQPFPPEMLFYPGEN